MGLKGTNIQLNNGLVADELYARINFVHGKNIFSISIDLYVDRDAYLAQKPIIDRDEQFFTADDTKTNIIQQAYDYIKTLPKYQGWIDVLETQ